MSNDRFDKKRREFGINYSNRAAVIREQRKLGIPLSWLHSGPWCDLHDRGMIFHEGIHICPNCEGWENEADAEAWRVALTRRGRGGDEDGAGYDGPG